MAARVAVQLGRQGLGDQPARADRAVLGDHLRGAPEQLGGGRVRRAAETQDHLGGTAVGHQVGVQAQQRGHADAASHQQRAGALGLRAKAGAQRSEQHQRLAGGHLAEPAGARPHVLEQEVQLHPAAHVAACARVREGARQERALAAAPSPPVARGQHVELARLRVLGADRVARGDQVVGAQAAHALDLGHPPLGRALGAVAHVATRLESACSSCSEVTCGASPRPARMARWAALAPLMVVMQGTPRATAARRIS